MFKVSLGHSINNFEMRINVVWFLIYLFYKITLSFVCTGFQFPTAERHAFYIWNKVTISESVKLLTQSQRKYVIAWSDILWYFEEHGFAPIFFYFTGNHISFFPHLNLWNLITESLSSYSNNPWVMCTSSRKLTIKYIKSKT